jgi:hypothetical protein
MGVAFEAGASVDGVVEVPVEAGADVDGVLLISVLVVDGVELAENTR